MPELVETQVLCKDQRFWRRMDCVQSFQGRFLRGDGAAVNSGREGLHSKVAAWFLSTSQPPP